MRRPPLLPSRVILWGGTGQAKVVRPILEAKGSRVVAVFDDTPGLRPPFPDVPLFEGGHGFERWASGAEVRGTGFVITIGNPHGRARLRLHGFLEEKGLVPATVIHETAWVEESAEIGPGAQIMAGAIVLAHARLGRQVIVNTKASVDHECVLEDAVEIAPGATLCGLITCEMNSWVCAGATVLPWRRIGSDAIVGAGAVVVTDVAANTTVVGVPAKPLGKSRRSG